MRNVVFLISIGLLFIQCESKTIVNSQFIDLLITGDSEDGELPNLYGDYKLFSKVENSIYLATNVDELKRIYLFEKVEGTFKDYLSDILNQRMLFPSEFITDDHYLFHLDQSVVDMELEELEERFLIKKDDNQHFYYYPDSRESMDSHLSLLYRFYKKHFTISLDCEIGSYAFIKKY